MRNPFEIAGILVGAAAAGLLLHAVVFWALRRRPAPVLGDGTVHRFPLQQSLVAKLDAPGRLAMPLGGIEIALASLDLPSPAGTVLVHVVGGAFVCALAWFVVRTTFVLDDIFLARYRLDAADNLRARRVHTQIQVLRRITVLFVSVIAAAIILLSFSAVRAEGAGLLASAGIIAIIAGVAARPTATNLMAGVQIALSQPIRVDDVVVVEGHWGRIEEIALTYVVVRVWDLRRLVLPISYFVEQPFENWTRSTADILGWVHIQVDYSAPVDEIRQAFFDILASSPDWDGQVKVLQVTTLGTETMQLRALMSSTDSSKSWNLQCEVRERLVAYIQQHHPDALPQLRTRRAASPPRAPSSGTPSSTASSTLPSPTASPIHADCDSAVNQSRPPDDWKPLDDSQSPPPL